MENRAASGPLDTDDWRWHVEGSFRVVGQVGEVVERLAEALGRGGSSAIAVYGYLEDGAQLSLVSVGKAWRPHLFVHGDRLSRRVSLSGVEVLLGTRFQLIRWLDPAASWLLYDTRERALRPASAFLEACSFVE